MIRYEAPAKLNLSLLVHRARNDGYHPLDSVVQTISWCDQLEIEESEVDLLTVSEPSLETSDNLVWKAVESVRRSVEVPPLELRLEKEIPVGAGLGGGSSDAAATLVAVSEMIGVEVDRQAAAALGADVPLFLEGGTQRMTGIGSELERLDPLGGFAVAVAVPGFGLSTASVYRKWDELNGPIGPLVPAGDLPDSLRGLGPMRNDLVPAALAVDERMGDFMALLEGEWGRAISLTGSGSACFAYFSTLEEAEGAARAISAMCRETRGVELRPCGVKEVSV